MKQFSEMGVALEKNWRKYNFDQGIFAELAANALTEFTNAASWPSLDDILHWSATTECLPDQADIAGLFGNPPITLFTAKEFFIDALIWTSSTTSIHSHRFTGAFMVYLGSSIHSTYQFDEKVKINDRISMGDLELENIQLLTKGDIKQIQPGNKFLHSIYHLDYPSITLIIRTYTSPSSGPQLAYHKPHFAIDPFFRDEQLQRTCQIISLLNEIKSPYLPELVATVLKTADFFTAFSILIHCNSLRLEARMMSGFVEIAKRTHATCGKFIAEVLEEHTRISKLARARGKVTDPEGRFLLALLLNVPNQGYIFQLIKERFPDQDPEDFILKWMDTFSQMSLFELKVTPVIKEISRLMLQTNSPEAVARAIQSQFEISADPDAAETAIKDLCLNISRDPIYKPLYFA